MYIGCLPTHRLKQPDLIALPGKRRQFQPGAVRREPPHDPTLAQSHIGIGTSHRFIEYLLIKNPLRGLAAYGPNGRRWRERLRLARDPSAMPGSDAYKAVAAE